VLENKTYQTKTIIRMTDSISSFKKTAKLTGLLYFIFALSAIYGYMYVSPKIMVSGDIAATGKNILANEFLYRTRIASDILTNILFVAVILMLYRFFSGINSLVAKFMAGLALVAIPVSFIGESLSLAAMQIFKGNLLTSFSPEQSRDIAEMLFKIGNYSHQLTTFHWGLWLIPMGWLVYKSGFIPRIFGILLFINGLGYMITSVTFMLFPASLSSVSKLVYPTWFMGEVPLILWLMIKGVKNITVQKFSLTE
jgi:hypothetical protein